MEPCANQWPSEPLRPIKTKPPQKTLKKLWFDGSSGDGRKLLLVSLMPGARQQLPMFMLPHLFPSFFNDRTQKLTSFKYTVY